MFCIKATIFSSCSSRQSSLNSLINLKKSHACNTHKVAVRPTLCVCMRYCTTLKGVYPGDWSCWVVDFAGRVWGDSKTFFTFTIFSSNISQASRNSPVPSERYANRTCIIFQIYTYHIIPKRGALW